jgi:arylsulfatase
LNAARATRLVLLACALAACGGDAPAPDLGPPLVVEDVVLDVIERLAKGDPRVRVVTEDAAAPLQVVPGSLDKGLELASDQSHLMLRAQAESALEVSLPALPAGARLQARTFVFSHFRNDPQQADPAPVTFRILLDGTQVAALSSDYITRPEGREHPYDILLRTLDVPLPAGRACTLRLQTTRDGRPVPEGSVLAEPVWWDLRVLARSQVARQAASPRAPNLLVLVADTLSGRRTSLLGYGRDTTPRLAALAERGVSFTHAVSPSSWTLPATASVLTGLPPNTHAVLGDERSYLMDGLDTWPEALRREGLAGAAFVANPLVAPANNFSQGFEHFEHLPAGGHGEPAEVLCARLLAWLDAQPRGARWFSYVHLMDPHAPYAAPGAARLRYGGPYVERRDFSTLQPRQLQTGEVPQLAPDEQAHLKNLYDGEVAYLDACLGRLLDDLAARGLLETTVVALTADHGEEFFEHGQLGHGYSLYEELLHVPLVLAGPGLPAGVRDPRPVSTAALAATLLELGGAPAQGLEPPLLPPLAAPRGPVFSAVRTQLFGPRHVLLSGRDAEGRKVVLTLDESGALQGAQCFHLPTDPGELRPLERERMPEAERAAWDALGAATLRWAEESAARRPPEPQPPQDPVVREAMRQIGYVGVDGPPETPR